MEDAVGFEEIKLRKVEFANDYIKEETSEPNLLSVIGFVGFGLAVFTALIKMMAEPFLKMFSFSTDYDAIPGVASAFGLVFAIFWFVCATLLLFSLVFKACYKYLKGYK